jgi:hypothetical protein
MARLSFRLPNGLYCMLSTLLGKIFYGSTKGHNRVDRRARGDNCCWGGSRWCCCNCRCYSPSAGAGWSCRRSWCRCRWSRYWRTCSRTPATRDKLSMQNHAAAIVHVAFRALNSQTSRRRRATRNPNGPFSRMRPPGHGCLSSVCVTPGSTCWPATREPLAGRKRSGAFPRTWFGRGHPVGP